MCIGDLHLAIILFLEDSENRYSKRETKEER